MSPMQRQAFNFSAQEHGAGGEKQFQDEQARRLAQIEEKLEEAKADYDAACEQVKKMEDLYDEHKRGMKRGPPNDFRQVRRTRRSRKSARKSRKSKPKSRGRKSGKKAVKKRSRSRK